MTTNLLNLNLPKVHGVVFDDLQNGEPESHYPLLEFQKLTAPRRGDRTLTDFHKAECLDALNDIKLRMRVERSYTRWNKDSLNALKSQRKILQSHVNKLNTNIDVKQDYLHQVDNDLETYRSLKV